MEIAVDLDRNCVRLDGKLISLTPRMCEIMAMFEQYPGRVIHTDRMAVAIYGDKEMKGASSTIKVLIYNLRERLKPHGFDILCYLSRGYELVERVKA